MDRHPGSDKVEVRKVRDGIVFVVEGGTIVTFFDKSPVVLEFQVLPLSKVMLETIAMDRRCGIIQPFSFETKCDSFAVPRADNWNGVIRVEEGR